ncbi:MurR/RpiR family transcriptional regulator [Clostridium oceanicum]|uniref:MurR/RpiR family transcriptional regulator n=1 Tax=Clostridium oceanicum TaxID=1543 RepID=A0ABP3ULJ0_9CLOT
MDFFTIVNEKKANLNKSESELLDFFIKNASNIKNMKIQDVASKTFISPASIIRFCKKLGFSGYSELKTNLSMSITDNDNLSISQGHNQINILKDIEKTKDMINDSMIDQILNLLDNANKIDFFGAGSSEMICKEISKKFRTLGRAAYSYDDSSIMFLSASSLKKNDVVFAISLSGETNSVLKASNIAKTRGATVISVTNMSINSLCKIADKSLFVNSTSFKIQNLNFESRLQCLFLMEYIFFKYLNKLNISS